MCTSRGPGTNAIVSPTTTRAPLLFSASLDLKSEVERAAKAASSSHECGMEMGSKTICCNWSLSYHQPPERGVRQHSTAMIFPQPLLSEQRGFLGYHC